MSINSEIGSQGKIYVSENPPQRSRCRVFVASHVAVANPDGLGGGLYDLSSDVILASVSENFQGQQAQLTILPRKPYIEWIFPGDWVSIYLSSGANASSSFGVLGDLEQEDEDIRVFYGFVDAIRTDVRVSENGTTQVRYTMSCSGIQKAFDRTMVYYNPELGPKTLFGALMPGLANILNNIYLSGTPATIPRTLALAYLGFGGQFLMPEGYANRIASEAERIARVKGLPEANRQIEQSLGMQFMLGQAGKPQKPGLAQRIIELSKKTFFPNSLATILDLFTYVNDYHVDGRIINTPFHDVQGSLWQLLAENSNPMLNECFVTLMRDKGEILGKDNDADEWGMRPRYVPALVLRERPFAWVDFRAFDLGIKQPYWKLRTAGRKRDGKKDEFEIPDVFFSSVVKPVKLPRLQQVSPDNFNFLPDLVSDKFHLDRVVISNKDIQEESIGLSDNDHFNFFMVSQANIPIQTSHQKFVLLQDGLIPVFIQESIKRYGLRLRELSTKFMYTGDKTIDGPSAFAFLVRTLLLYDMWYQHSAFYRAGTIRTRGLPKARVGMALDILGSGREESFYIEGCGHEWSLEAQGRGKLSTTFTLTRGQPGVADWRKRFMYAPPDSVEMLIGNTPVPRKAKEKQDPISRSPIPDNAARVQFFMGLLKDIQEVDSNLKVSMSDVFAEITSLSDKNPDNITPDLIKTALRNVLAKDPGFFNAYQFSIETAISEYDAAVADRMMPPLIKIKEDRQLVGLPPWAVQSTINANGGMWDPVRRSGSEQNLNSIANKAFDSLFGKKG